MSNQVTAAEEQADRLLAENARRMRNLLDEAQKDGASAGDSTLAGPHFVLPSHPKRCSECRRTTERSDGCAHVVCPMRRSLTAQPRDEDQP